ncbi:ERF family protein [Arthrobacter sp. AL12]|uniref:ERF family protein n=1 Tax=Arthrobacter sp. AL12 TaxID=3042241 RepID=UPI00249CB8F8|nr:ERF family protein [Arthrobacter sp. AL12]MDI3211789.1 ERF family protein [Arthrobacter sp. AL12]
MAESTSTASLESSTPTPPSTTMEIPADIAKALVALQAEVQGLGKTAKNDHFKNTYAPLDEVMDAALPLLTKNKLSLMQWPITVGTEHFLHSVLAHESGVSMQSDIKLLLVKQDPQGLGSALTYTRRQSVMAILGLSAKDEDDDGNKASNHLPPPTQEHLDEIAAICKSLKFPEEEVDRKLRGLRTDDQAVIALDDLDKIMAGRAAAVRARKAADNAQTIPVGDEPSHVSTEAIAKRLQALQLRDNATIRQFIKVHTGKTLIGACKADDLAKLDEVLARVESGEEKLPGDWYGSTDHEQIVQEDVA